jgi:hypothetical protein
MAYGGPAGQTLGKVRIAEGLSDTAHMAFSVEPLAIETGDPAGFLAAMLQSVQAKGRQTCSLGCAIDAEDPAFQAQTVVIGVPNGG